MKRRSSFGLERRKAATGAVFTLPWLVGFALFVAYPLGFSLLTSFSQVNVAGFTMRFTGLANFTRAFAADVDFLPTLLQTLRNVLIDTPVILVFSLAIAILLNRNLRGQQVLRAIFFLPVIIGSGYVMKELFTQGVGGLSVALGVETSVSPQVSAIVPQNMAVALKADTGNIIHVSAFLRQYLGPELATGINEFLNRLGLSLWRSGIQILLFYAGLQGISEALYEAGRIDGANEWTLFWKVTLPVVSPIIIVAVVFTIVDSFTDTFNPMLAYINTYSFFATGADTNTTRTAFESFGYASAMSWIYFLMIFIVLLIVQVTVGRRVYYRGEK